MAADPKNPALELVEPPRTPQRYRVSGTSRVRDTAPGKTFTALFTPEQEAALIWGGHITPIKERA